MGSSVLAEVVWFIRSLFCRHDFEFFRNLHDDEINGCDGKRSLWVCRKCQLCQMREDTNAPGGGE